MGVLHSKHQKLILQCYPPGKGVDKKPNPSELSYLLYYASTRRVKLEKVIEFLKSKTKADVRGRKSGNLSVTLSIVSALIEKCFDNLNAFAPQVCEIMSAILPLKELPLSKALVATYGVFCAKLDNGLFSGDKVFVDSFSRLTHDLITLAESQSAAQATNTREWKMVSLLTCRHVFSCLGYNSQVSAKFIPLSISILAPVVASAFSLDCLSSRLKASLNVEQGNDRLLTKVVTGKSVHLPDTSDSLEGESVTSMDLGEEALLGLHALFHTSLSPQISAATRSVVEHDFKNGPEERSSGWGPVFLQVCASSIPVQLRFETLLTLLNTLSSIADQATEKAPHFSHMRHYATYVMSLVSSGFNMIGLSISDILVQLLTLKTNLYLHLSEILSPSEVNELSVIYSECICNLSSHIYYFDQVSDSIEGILFQVDNVLLGAEAKSAQKVYVLVLDLLEMISKIMDLLAVNSSAISWNHATLENWDVSFQLLTFQKSYPKFASLVAKSDISHIQAKYLEVVQGFLDRELSSRINKQQANEVDVTARYLEPNYKNFIQDRGNPLNTMLLHCSDYFEEDTFDAASAKALARIMSIIAGITGINFAYNFIQVFGSWQLQRPTSATALVAKDQCAYTVLQALIFILNDKYQDLLKEDISSSTLAQAVQQDVQNRTSLLWRLPGHATSSDDLFKNQISVGLIESFFAQTPLRQWLVSPNTFLLDFEDEGHRISRSSVPERDDASFSSAVQHYASKLGLGTANDISSIYSGLNGQTNGNGKAEVYTPDTSHVTQGTLQTHGTSGTSSAADSSFKRFLMPRVEDLKHSVDGTAGDKFTFGHGAESKTQSVLQKKTRPADVRTILEDLKFEDDRQIIV